MSDDVRLIGVEELYRKFDNPVWMQRPWRRMLDRWSGAVQLGAVQRMKRGPGGWVDRGSTRQSISTQIDSGPFPMFARVGSNRDSARWGEYGTGLLSEDPKSAHRRHFPPYGAGTELDDWARRHNLNAYLVARSIWRRGGIKPRRFLRESVASAEKHIPAWLDQMAKDVEEEASRGA